MTTETREEIDLMVDTISDLTSGLNDHQTTEEDEMDDFARNSPEAKLNRFNQKELKVAQAHLDRAKTTLQGIVTFNS